MRYRVFSCILYWMHFSPSLSLQPTLDRHCCIAKNRILYCERQRIKDADQCKLRTLRVVFPAHIHLRGSVTKGIGQRSYQVCTMEQQHAACWCSPPSAPHNTTTTETILYRWWWVEGGGQQAAALCCSVGGLEPSRLWPESVSRSRKALQFARSDRKAL